MCGFPLRAQQPAASAPVRRDDPPLAVSSFSILGLQDSSREDHEPSLSSGASSNIDYLLEDDETESSHRGTYITLLFLAVVVAAAALAWNWQRGAFEPTSRPSKTLANPAGPETSAVKNDVPASANSVPGEPTSPATANPEASETALPPSSRHPASESPAVVAPNPVPEPEVVPENNEAAAAQPAQDQENDSSKVRITAPRQGKPRPGVSGPAVRSPEAPSGDNPPATPSASDAAISRFSSAAPRQVRQAAPSTDSQLFAEGENYLYGDGVVKDCTRAEKDLRVAAGHAYPPAESLLGTMYASGHCVGRDLPMAYRWYARALHHDPANTRIQSDLEVLWKQMTPAEKRATQSGQ